MDEIRPKSRLPADPAYWEAFAGRVTAAAGSELAGSPRARDAWWAVLADVSPFLAGSAVAAALAGWLFLPAPRPAAEAGPGTLVARTLAPTDAVARTLLRESAPPIGELVFSAAAEAN